MRIPIADAPLPRPGPSPQPGPLDESLYDLVEARFRRLLAANPVLGTAVGLHERDDRLPDGSRDALLGELDADRRHLAAVEALDGDGLSAEARFERDVELHNVRRAIFEADVVRTWERRSTALDSAGDALFLLFARDFAPLPERLQALTGRLEALPGNLAEHRTRATVPQVRLWQRLEIEAARELPPFVDEIVAAGRVLPDAERRRLERAGERARRAIADYARGLEQSLEHGTDEWSLGRERFGALLELRALDGLQADAILEIGWQQLAASHAERSAAAREVDPGASEAAVIDRVKADHAPSFEAALAEYRDAMLRARAHVVERGLASVPADEHLDVIATPEHLRTVVPFAAYFEPPKFDRRPAGLYVVTPAVGGNPTAMREHNRSSISNTSIHEAYPGHHLQLSVASRHPSLSRLLVDAPEFVEGWAMYAEQLMREEGFDDGPAFRLAMHTDAIWRACRIILDVRMHRGEMGVQEAARFLVEHTAFERANARAEVERYTYTPGYQLSYLLGKVLLVELREAERRRLGAAWQLREFHDALLANGSLPVSFHRRLLAAATERAA